MSKMNLCKKLLVADIEATKEALLSCCTYVQEHETNLKDASVYSFAKEVYVLEEYKKNLRGLAILVFLSANENPKLLQAFEHLVDITEDKRYDKEYLKLFGNPKKYDFDLQEVYKKCDDIGLERLDLHFKQGMSSGKVFKVLLYRLSQSFHLEVQAYFKDDTRYERVREALAKLVFAFEISQELFHKKSIKRFLKNLQSLYLLLNHKDKMDRYLFDFEAFIHDSSGFYESKKANEPIFFYLQTREDEREKEFISGYLET